MKSAFFIFVAGSLSVLLAGTLQPETSTAAPATIQTDSLAFTPARNVTVGPYTVWVAYPTCEILFYPEQDKAVIEKDGERTTVYGDVFQPEAGEILLTHELEYIRLNMQTGRATIFLKGEMLAY